MRWHETAQAAIRRAREMSDDGFVSTQGHVLTTSDFVATLVVEATVHHIDLLVSTRHGPEPAASALGITTRTLDLLLQAPRPAAWDDTTYIVRATGREPLSTDDRVTLGDAAARIPLFS